MSELKYYKLRHIVSALASPDFTTGVVFGNHDEVYNKSEADKVIVDLRNEADVYKAKYEQEYDIAVHNEKQLSAMRIELRRHKYKRCLAMAEKCESMCYWFSARFDHHELVDNVKWELFDRWRLRWAKLADKFKEAK